MYKIIYRKVVAKDIERLKDVHLSEKAKNIIDIIKENPFQSPPPYEKLIGNLQGTYSRRISIQHRLVYQVMEKEKIAKILRMWSHYENI